MSDLTPLTGAFDRPPRDVVDALLDLSTTELADVLEPTHIVRRDLHPLWPGMPRVAGPAFTVKTGTHDNLMLHAAIYLAEPGDVLVVEAGDDDMAVAGGNVMAIMQRRGVAGLVVDGVVRDVGEAFTLRFPVYARGRSPIAAKRVGDGGLHLPVRVGGALVSPGDVVLADHEGIVVVPCERAPDVLAKATAKAKTDRALDLDAWQARHRTQVEQALAKKGLKLP